MRWSQMMGVEPEKSGNSSFQVTFSVAVQVTGTGPSLATPFMAGPRHCGQFPPWATV